MKLKNIGRSLVVGIFALTCAAAAFVSAGVSSNGVAVSISMDKRVLAANDDVVVNVVMTNNSSVNQRILRWATPFQGVEGNLFDVTRDGKRVAFLGAVYKRPAPTASDYILLKPGQTMRKSVELSKLYDMSVTGDYAVTFHSSSEHMFANVANLQAESFAASSPFSSTSASMPSAFAPASVAASSASHAFAPASVAAVSASHAFAPASVAAMSNATPASNAFASSASMATAASSAAMGQEKAELKSEKITLWIEGRFARGTAAVSAPIEGFATAGLSFSQCSASQSSTVTSAFAAAKNMANGSNTYMAANVAGTRYTTWFGVYDATRFSTVKTHFVKIKDAFDNKAVTIDCGCTGSYYAYVYPNKPYKIYVCNAFWSAPMTGTDSKGGTLIHEMSHFDVVADTDDLAYGQTAAKNLAKTKPASAIRNADSHEYFSE